MGVPHPTPFLFFFHTDVLHRAHRDRMASRFSQHNGQSSTFATPHAHTPMLALQARRLVLRRLLSFPISFPVADFIVGQWRPEHWKQVYYTYPADQDGVSKRKVSKATVKISKGHENSRRASTCVLARKHNHILAVFNSPPPHRIQVQISAKLNTSSSASTTIPTLKHDGSDCHNVLEFLTRTNQTQMIYRR
jgi:hypothetical protein